MLNLVGLCLGSLGALTSAYLLGPASSDADLESILRRVAPLLIFIGLSAIFEVIQWLYLPDGKRLRRAVWYGAYIFGAVFAPLLLLLL